MIFASLTFLFLFLPIVLGIYYLFRGHRNIQNIFLFISSLFFYAWGEPIYVLLLIASIVFNWAMAIFIDKSVETIKKIFLAISIVFNIGILFVFKYLTFTVVQINRVIGSNISVKEFALPIGISFFTFQALSYVIDVYRGEKLQKNLFHVGLYISFFPQLIAGPIVRYNSISEQLTGRKESVQGFKSGVIRFIGGFSKKVLLANTLAVISDRAFSIEGNNMSVSFAWLGAIAYTLQIYFDFSGYSDMAIGLGRMFGFNFDENFNYPYISTSITEFWRRWHISLSRWFRDYVYIPLGGNRTGKVSRNLFNLLIVWILTGIWHGANWTFIFWGLLYFFFLLIEKTTFVGSFIKKFKFVGHVYTLIVVTVLWVIFRADGIHHAISYIKSMFGLGGISFYSGQTWVYFRENMICIIGAIIFSTDWLSRFSKFVSDKSAKLGKVLETIGEICLFILFLISVVYIINGTYNPFIYFNF